MDKNKFQCEGCGYYWKIGRSEKLLQNCPVCGSIKIHRAAKHKRFAKKSRPRVRRSLNAPRGRT